MGANGNKSEILNYLYQEIGATELNSIIDVGFTDKGSILIRLEDGSTKSLMVITITDDTEHPCNSTAKEEKSLPDKFE
jgi:hypothetical protein